MKRETVNPALQVTGACNKNCDACLRPPEMRKHHLKRGQFRSYLDDLAALSGLRRIHYQFVTGGEPTIWRDGDQDIVDILAALTDLDHVGTIVMPTNGKVFEDRDNARELLPRLADRISRPIVIAVSVARYQHNLDREAGCAAIENLLGFGSELGGKVLPVALVTLAVDDDTDEQLSKEWPNLYQRVTPLAPLGGAAEMREECPSLGLGSTDKTPLGSFLPHFRRDVVGKLKISDDEFEGMPNDEIINGLSLYNNCGKSPFVDKTWHYCLPFLHHASFDLGRVGEMQGETIGRFVERAPFLRAVRRRGVITAIRELRGRLPHPEQAVLDGLFDTTTQVSVAYRGCMVCRDLFDRLGGDPARWIQQAHLPTPA